MNFNPCLIIPIFNHKETIAETISSLRQYNLPCFVIDDGSDFSTQQILSELSTSNPEVRVERLAVNQGKGAAVMNGMSLAHAEGFSHALQIDADGQHNIEDIPRFLCLAEKQPDALICGQPLYDESIPKVRLMSRYISHFWVGVETLTVNPVDSMCGFRVYPLGAILDILKRVRVGCRMDFDTEILVRSIWQKIPIVKVSTRVIYPASGISHFDYLRDNVLITKMHTRLVFAMLVHLPSRIYRFLDRIYSARSASERSQSDSRPAASEKREFTHWSKTRERGISWGIHSLLWIYRLLGRRILGVLLYPIIGYFFITNRQMRRASESYLSRVYRTGSDHPRMHSRPQLKDSFYHYMEFGRSVLDRVSSWLGDIDKGEIDFDNKEEFFQLAGSGRGGLIIGAHLGNIELSRALAGDLGDIKINALVFTEHAEKFNAMLSTLNSKVSEQLIQVNKIGPDTAILLKGKIDRGELIIILGDRTAANSTGHVSQVGFLGDQTEFGQGPFILASLLKCPVYLMFCLKEESGYRVYFEPFSDQLMSKRKTRSSDLQSAIQKYVSRLEFYCLKQPFQWFNFYDYWREEQRREEKRNK